jgi:hypothetical protein
MYQVKKVFALIVLSIALVFTAKGQGSVVYVYGYDWTVNTGDPTGVAKNDSGNVFITDYTDNSIQKYASDGGFAMRWGTPGSGNGQLSQPVGIAADDSGYVYVAERGNNRIQKFSTTGACITQWGSAGTGDGQFDFPCGIAVDDFGNVYVTDNGNNRVQKFTSSGTYITQWGGFGTAAGQFSSPGGIAVHADSVYVIDGNNRLQKFSTTGTYITEWGAPGQFHIQPAQGGIVYNVLGVSKTGDVFVADNGDYNVKVFTSAGNFITQWGSQGNGAGQFNNPIGIAADTAGQAFVIDKNNSSVAVFHIDALGIESLQHSTKTFVYPNPASESVMLQISSTENVNAVVSIYDILGQKVWSENKMFVNGQNKITLSTQGLFNGLYLVKINSNSLQSSFPLVIQK